MLRLDAGSPADGVVTMTGNWSAGSVRRRGWPGGHVAVVLVLLAAIGVLVDTGAAEAARSTASSCRSRSLQIVAHQDDDLLFMNPDVYRDLRAGACVRTVYLTAGDAGHGEDYWSRRETGALAALASLAGVRSKWRLSSSSVAGARVVTARSRYNSRISAVFLRLPDGLYGGYRNEPGYRSLRALWEDPLATTSTIDGRSQYSASTLHTVLVSLIAGYAPDRIRTQARGDFSGTDHPDHQATGLFAVAAAQAAGRAGRVVEYVGYAIAWTLPNVDGAELNAKYKAFGAYAAYDGLTCPPWSPTGSCAGTATSNPWSQVIRNWMPRQYTVGQPMSYPDTQVRAPGGLCLQVSGPSGANGTAVEAVPCADANSDPQRWARTAAPSSRLVGYAAKCLDADANGTAVLWDCLDRTTQRWTFTTSNTLVNGDGRCLTRDPVGPAVRLATCDASAEQRWGYGAEVG